MTVILILTLIISVFVFFSHEYIFEIFTSESYYEYSYLLTYLVLSGGIFSASQVLTMTYQYKLEIKKLMSGKIVVSCIGITSNFIAAYFFSLHAIAISSVIFSIANIIYFYSSFNKLESNLKIN